MLRSIRRFALWVGVILATPTVILAQSFDTSARAAYVVDLATDTVLLSKNAAEPLPPASMSKLMTVYMAFEAIADGRLTIDERLPVSTHAAGYGGSTMFLDTTDRVTVEDLLRGVIVLSGNDASAVLAEAISPDGTEAGFARLMTERARQLGMNNSTFSNSNGWPAAGHRMSMQDLGILATRLITDYPTFYPLFKETSFAFDGRAPANTQNRNPLLKLGIGADGLKTGHTSEAGYGLVGSVKRGDRRIIFVITGLDSERARAEEAERIVNWAFRQFAQKQVVTSGTRIAEADVWMGDQPTVGLTVAEDHSMLVPTLGMSDGIKAEAIFDSPITAPIRQGQELGELIIALDGLPEARIPLIADRNVAAGGFKTRMATAAQVLLQKLAPTPETPAEPAS